MTFKNQKDAYETEIKNLKEELRSTIAARDAWRSAHEAMAARLNAYGPFLEPHRPSVWPTSPAYPGTWPNVWCSDAESAKTGTVQ